VSVEFSGGDDETVREYTTTQRERGEREREREKERKKE
jgi:hypothetical protein